MIHSLISTPVTAAALLFGVLHSSAAGEDPEISDPPKGTPLVRIVCATGIPKDQTFILASPGEEGKWLEFGEVQLRPSFITDWQAVAAGKIHLAVRQGDGLVSKTSFSMPSGVDRAIAILLPDGTPDGFRADLMVPEKLSFRKGSTLVVNYSRVDAAVGLGSRKAGAKPGQRVLMKPAAGDDGMFRMLVGYKKPTGEQIVCYDRYVPENPESRDLLLLLPDSTLGLRVLNISEFGPFE